VPIIIGGKMYKHGYLIVYNSPLDLLPLYFKCKFCGDEKYLKGEQIKNMSYEMAKCKKSNKKVTFLEKLTGNIDCYGGCW
jgi:hypothetical protein